MPNELIQNIVNNSKKPYIIQKGIWQYPSQIERQYIAFVKKLFQPFTALVAEKIRPNLERWQATDSSDYMLDSYVDELDDIGDEYQQLQNELFAEKKDSLANEILMYGAALNLFNRKQAVKVYGQTFNLPKDIVSTVLPYEPWTDVTLQAWVKNNISLIKGLTDDHIKQINNAIVNGIQSNMTIADLSSELTKINKNFSANRTRLIARDQINKLNSVLTQKRQTDVGVSFYQWQTARDERVRSNHRAMQGKICTWNDPTVYADSLAEASAGKWKSRGGIGGVMLHPGQDIQCRCYSNAIFTKSD